MGELKFNKTDYLGKLRVYFICLVAVLLFNFLATEAQGQILIGPKVGARMNWLNYQDFNSEDFEKSPAFGYTAGITTAFKVQRRFLLQVDLMYAQNGRNIEGITGPQFRNDAKYHFINTPAVYKLDFKRAVGKNSFKYYIGAGPNVNFWLGGKGELESVELREEFIDLLEYNVKFGEFPADPEFDAVYIENPNIVQVGLIVSTGIVLEPAAGQSLIIDFRYEWGHSYLARGEGNYGSVVSYSDNLQATNQAFQVSVAYVLDIVNQGEKEKKNYYD